MKIEKIKLEGALVIHPDIHKDKRGYFYETYNKEIYNKLGLPDFVQENQSKSSKDVLRGLHFQKNPHSQGKLVRVIEGRVLDVIVDLRKKSKTYGKHFKIILSSKNKKELYVPTGFAHGFLVLSKEAIFSYLCTDIYHHECEDGILYNDEDLNIDWGIENPIVSEKDLKNKKFKEIKTLNLF